MTHLTFIFILAFIRTEFNSNCTFLQLKAVTGQLFLREQALKFFYARNSRYNTIVPILYGGDNPI